MVALTAARNTPRRDPDVESHPVKAAVTIYAGALVCLDVAGWAQGGAVATTLIAIGRAEESVVNAGGANGAKSVKVRRGVFRFANSSAADLITRAEIGDTCYVVDDQTVAKTDGGATRSIAGKIRDLDAVGVWVEF